MSTSGSQSRSTVEKCALLLVMLIISAAIPVSSRPVQSSSYPAFPHLKRDSPDNAQQVRLHNACPFALLAQSSITSTGNSYIEGNLGIAPGNVSNIFGFDPLLLASDNSSYSTYQAGGLVYDPNNVGSPTSSAISDSIAAYNAAVAQPNPDYTGYSGQDLGGSTLIPGLYSWSGDLEVGSDLSLKGNCGDVFVFVVSGNLTISSNVKVSLAGGVSASSVFWAVGGAFVAASQTEFSGILLTGPDTTVSLGYNATLTGMVYAGGSIYFQDAAIIRPGVCYKSTGECVADECSSPCAAIVVSTTSSSTPYSSTTTDPSRTTSSTATDFSTIKGPLLSTTTDSSGASPTVTSITTATSTESRTSTTTTTQSASTITTTASFTDSQTSTTTATSIDSQTSTTTATSTDSQTSTTTATATSTSTQTATSTDSQTSTTTATSTDSQTSTTTSTTTATSTDSRTSTTTATSTDSQTSTTTATSIDSRTTTIISTNLATQTSTESNNFTQRETITATMTLLLTVTASPTDIATVTTSQISLSTVMRTAISILPRTTILLVPTTVYSTLTEQTTVTQMPTTGAIRFAFITVLKTATVTAGSSSSTATTSAGNPGITSVASPRSRSAYNGPTIVSLYPGSNLMTAVKTVDTQSALSSQVLISSSMIRRS